MPEKKTTVTGKHTHSNKELLDAYIGMLQHGNEYHSVDFSETGHNHSESEITGLVNDLTSKITSNPPSGKYKVTNLYFNPDTNKIHIVYEET